MENYKKIEESHSKQVQLLEDVHEDGNKTYAVRIKEDDKISFMIIECLDYLGAKKLYDSLNETSLSIVIY